MDAVSLAGEVLNRAGIRRAGVSVIGMNRSQPGQDQLALLVFIDGRTEPALFVKATPDPRAAQALRRESDNLSFLARRLGPTLERTVPATVWFGELDGLTVLAETAMSGTRMKNFPPQRYFRSARFLRHLANVVAWLGSFQEALTADRGVPITPADGARGEIEAYRAGFRVSSRLDDLLAESAERLMGRGDLLGPWHGDFCTANVLVANDRDATIIDWEQPLVRTSPLADLLHFLASVWCVPYKKGAAARVTNYLTMFFGEHRLTRPVVDAARGFTRRLGLESSDLLGLSVLAWVAHANRKRRLLSHHAAAAEGASAAHWPLVMFEDESCLNLELLAEHRNRYVLSGYP